MNRVYNGSGSVREPMMVYHYYIGFGRISDVQAQIWDRQTMSDSEFRQDTVTFDISND